MRLLLKFNLIFALVFALGLIGCGWLSRDLLQRNAKEEILEHARLLMEKAIAVRNYTTAQIQPLLGTQMKYTFLPQSVPAYAATDATICQAPCMRCGADAPFAECSLIRLASADA